MNSCFVRNQHVSELICKRKKHNFINFISIFRRNRIEQLLCLLYKLNIFQDSSTEICIKVKFSYLLFNTISTFVGYLMPKPFS